MADAAVCNECSRGRVRAQRVGPCNRGAVNNTGTRNVQTSQHLIEQRCVSSCARGVERVQKTIPENIHSIDRKCIPELRAFARDICRAQQDVARQLALNLKVEVLNVRAYAVISCPLHDVVPGAVDRDRLKRRKLLRYR